MTNSGNVYSYTTLGNEFAVPGVVVADLKFYDNGDTQRVSTASFIFNVDADTLDGLGGGTAGYSDELETLSAAMEGYIEAFGNMAPMNPRGDYDANEDYNPGDCVYYGGLSWFCLQPCTGETPTAGSAYWQKVADPAVTKADKVSGATNGHLAGLDANGNLTDSGKSADEITAIENAGAKNRVILDLSAIKAINTAGTWSGNVYSYRSVDFTVTDSGVAVSGTASGGASFLNIPTTLENGISYTANGVSGGSNNTYMVVFLNSGGTAQSTSDLFDGEVNFTKNSSTDNVEIYRIRVANGANVSTNIYPMIRDARITDPTFVPYAMTNRELTDNFPIGFPIPQEIQQTDNLNNYTQKSGLYFWKYAPTNADWNNGYMLLFANPDLGAAIQIIFCRDNNNAYRRVLASGSWTKYTSL